MIQTPSLPLPLESSQSFCRRQTDTVGMAPLAHAEGYLGPPEGYPTDGHSLPLTPRGEVGDRSTSEYRGSCKKSEWGRRDGGSGNTDDPCRPPGGSPAVAADVIQQRCTCVVSLALCDRVRHPLCQWGRRSGEHDDDP